MTNSTPSNPKTPSSTPNTASALPAPTAPAVDTATSKLSAAAASVTPSLGSSERISTKDIEYSHEIARRAVAIACLQLGVTECTVEVLDVLADSLIDFLEKVRVFRLAMPVRYVGVIFFISYIFMMFLLIFIRWEALFRMQSKLDADPPLM